MPVEKAYSDILSKLKRLIFPTLFLSNLEQVSWKTDNNDSGTYLKEIIENKQNGDIVINKTLLRQDVDLESTDETLFLFSRKHEGLTYSVGFFLKNDKIIPKKLKAFCYFLTEETTGLNFIIHAPFQLNNSRASIPRNQSNDWNESLVLKLAELAADFFPILKELNLNDDEITCVAPYKKAEFYNLFAPFYDKIKNLFLSEEILPSSNGEFTRKANSYWATAPNLPHLFTNEQLATLYNNRSAKWVFTSKGATNLQSADKELAEYIRDLTSSVIEPKAVLVKINHEFIQSQNIQWLHKLYEYLSERRV